MKLSVVLMSLWLVVGTAHSKEDEVAMNAFKHDPKIVKYLANKSLTNYWIKYQQLELDGICGFAGCEWRKLVTMKVTSKSSNAPSVTILAVVNGMAGNVKIEPKVNFVKLVDMQESAWPVM